MCETENSMDLETGRFIHKDGISVHYKVFGDQGPHMIFVHGGGGAMDVWRQQAALISQKARCVFIDLPGHGLSSAPMGIDYSMALCARSIAEVCEQEEITQATFVGHSMGAPVLVELYRRNPSLFSALISIDGFIVSPPITQQLRMASRLLRSWLFVPVWAFTVKSLTTKIQNPDSRQMVSDRMRSTPDHVVKSSFHEMVRSLQQPADLFSIPVVVAFADQSLWTDAHQAAVRVVAPQIEWHDMSGASHFLMLDREDEINALIMRTLADAGASSSGA